MRIKTKIVSYHTADSKPVKQEVNGTVILPPLVFPALAITIKNATLYLTTLGKAAVDAITMSVVMPSVAALSSRVPSKNTLRENPLREKSPGHHQ